MAFRLLANADFIRPWIILKQDDPWNVVIGLAAIFLFWRAINRAMDKPDPFDG